MGTNNLIGGRIGLEVWYLTQKRLEGASKSIPIATLRIKNQKKFSEEELELLKDCPEILDLQEISADDKEAVYSCNIQIDSLLTPVGSVFWHCQDIIEKTLNPLSSL